MELEEAYGTNLDEQEPIPAMCVWRPIETAPRDVLILGMYRHPTLPGNRIYKVGHVFDGVRPGVFDCVIEPKTGRFHHCTDWRPVDPEMP